MYLTYPHHFEVPINYRMLRYGRTDGHLYENEFKYKAGIANQYEYQSECDYGCEKHANIVGQSTDYPARRWDTIWDTTI